MLPHRLEIHSKIFIRQKRNTTHDQLVPLLKTSDFLANSVDLFVQCLESTFVHRESCSTLIFEAGDVARNSIKLVVELSLHRFDFLGDRCIYCINSLLGELKLLGHSIHQVFQGHRFWSSIVRIVIGSTALYRVCFDFADDR
uniref:(northern house mosquito) hypothetical protein n=1 Tax=Culex pipiens TaxID=7175 RepID=A0A8D8A7L0_CULPI